MDLRFFFYGSAESSSGRRRDQTALPSNSHPRISNKHPHPPCLCEPLRFSVDLEAWTALLSSKYLWDVSLLNSPAEAETGRLRGTVSRAGCADGKNTKFKGTAAELQRGSTDSSPAAPPQAETWLLPGCMCRAGSLQHVFLQTTREVPARLIGPEPRGATTPV